MRYTRILHHTRNWQFFQLTERRPRKTNLRRARYSGGQDDQRRVHIAPNQVGSRGTTNNVGRNKTPKNPSTRNPLDEDTTREQQNTENAPIHPESEGNSKPRSPENPQATDVQHRHESKVDIVPKSEQADVMMAAGEKRAGGSDPPAKRRPTQGGASDPKGIVDPKLASVIRTGHRDAADHLSAIGLHKIVTNRATSKSVEHACLHNASTDDGSCACCFAEGTRATSHRRDVDRERTANTWHGDVVGPVRERGLGLDPVGNFKSGTYAAIYTNDAIRDIVFPILRSSTRSSETEGDLTLVRARTAGTKVEIRSLRHDRGPEYTGARSAMQKVEIIPVPSVDHGATSEAINIRVQVGTRRTRRHAGLPETLWPIAMAAYCFCVGWWHAASRGDNDRLKKRLQGDFVPMPVGARVQYLPRATEDRKKTERFAAYVKYGIFFGYAQDLVPARAYWVCDELDLFQKGVLRIVASENVELLAVAGADGENKLLYSFLLATDAARAKAVAAIKRVLPGATAGGAKRPRGEAVVTTKDIDLRADVPPAFVGITATDEVDEELALDNEDGEYDGDDPLLHSDPRMPGRWMPTEGARGHSHAQQVPTDAHKQEKPHVVASHCTPMPVEPDEALEAILRSAQPDRGDFTHVKPGPQLTPDEIETILAADEQVPFVDPATECVMVTELLSKSDARHSCDAAVAARRKEVADLNKHNFADWAGTVRLDEWEAADRPGTWSRKMMPTSIKNSENTLAEQIYKGRLVDCGHRVYNSKRRDVTELQRALLKKHELIVRPVSATEWRAAFVAEATSSLVDEYELLVMIADELQAYVKTRRPSRSDPQHLLLREPDLEWVPDAFRERIAAQLKRCRKGVLLRLLVYLYGDIEAGFRYEERRNSRNVATADSSRPAPSTVPAPRFSSSPTRPSASSPAAPLDAHWLHSSMTTSSWDIHRSLAVLPPSSNAATSTMSPFDPSLLAPSSRPSASSSVSTSRRCASPSPFRRATTVACGRGDSARSSSISWASGWSTRTPLAMPRGA